MKTSDLLDLIGDDGITQRVYSRRGMLKGSAASAAALALAGMPFGLAALSTSAGAQSADTVVPALQLALKLEYLESAFYRLGLASLTSAFNAAELAAIRQISKHEDAHVAFLTSGLQSVGATIPAKPADSAFDFSGGSGNKNGPFANVFLNKAEFMKLGQLFEDTGVRAYKGQALNVQPNKTFLEYALRIHSVEARHAAKIRRLRGQTAYITLTPVDSAYTTTAAASGKSQADLASAVYGAGSPAASYPAESNTTQAGLDLTTALSGATALRVAEAFDEPLDAGTVVTIAGFFGVK